MKNVPFYKYQSKKKDYIEIKKVLSSGWLTTGEKTLQFEEMFKKKIGCKYALAVNSCTSALQISLLAAGVKKNSKVLVPSLTFVSCAEVIFHIGATPIFVDVDADTHSMDIEDIKKKFSKYKDISALIFVHFAGHPTNLSDRKKNIQKFCDEKNIKIIEDASHALPSKINNKYIGNTNNLCCFSFYANKTLTTAEGGMITFNNKKFLKKIKLLRSHGFSKDSWNRFTAKNKWEYDVVMLGYKNNLADLNSALGISHLKFLDKDLKKRKCIAKCYDKLLNNNKNIKLPFREIKKGYQHSWHLYRVSINFKSSSRNFRDKVIKKLSEKGLVCSVHYKPIHLMSYFKKNFNQKLVIKNTEKIWNTTVSLPIYPSLKLSDVKILCKELNKLTVS